MAKHRGALLALSLAAVCSSTACISNRTLAANAVSYNLAVERAQNRMLFLNVIRASNRSPTYLTDVSKVTGSIKTEVGASLEYMFGGNDAYKNSVTPGASYSLNPTFDVNVLSTQEFMRGFLQPITNETLGYYLDQGWPPEFLLHLFVRAVRVRTPAGTVEINGKRFEKFEEIEYDNYPDANDQELCDLRRFSKWVFDELLDERSPRVESISSSAGGPIVGVGGVGDLEALVNALTGGISVKNVGDMDGKYSLEKVEKELHLHIVFKEGAESPGQPPAAKEKYLDATQCTVEPEARIDLVEEKEESDKKPAERQEEKGEMRVERLKVPQPGAPQGDAKKEEAAVALVMRSPEAIMYYLGELMRVEARGRVPEVCIQGSFQPIFFAQKEGGNCPSAVEADYENDDYIIPASSLLDPPEEGGRETGRRECRRGQLRISKNTGCVQSRSMQALSLLSQLIALQKSAKDLPITDVVRVIGQ